MKLVQNAFKKFEAIRKKNWSAPAIMSVFILICMLIVYSFEAIGLLNKERNLMLRSTKPETLIKNKYRDIKIFTKNIYKLFPTSLR